MNAQRQAFGQPFIYEIRRGVEIYRGRADEIAVKAGHTPGWVRVRSKRNDITRDGWEVRLIRGEPMLRKRVRIMMAEKEGDDPIIGTSEEIATLLGVTDSCVRRLRRSGKVSRGGWTIRVATEEEIAEYDIM